MAELTEAAIGARRRVERALDSVGPGIRRRARRLLLLPEGAGGYRAPTPLADALRQAGVASGLARSPGTTGSRRKARGRRTRPRSCTGARTTIGRRSSEPVRPRPARPTGSDRPAPQPVRALRRQVRPEIEAVEDGLRVGGENLASASCRRRAPARSRPARARSARRCRRRSAGRSRRRHLPARPQPHLAGAAADLVRLGAFGVGQAASASGRAR
jgi:hypothetical protein